VALEARGPAE
jgi:hypothetical protein